LVVKEMKKRRGFEERVSWKEGIFLKRDGDGRNATPSKLR
jgi:hypothetical protein